MNTHRLYPHVFEPITIGPVEIKNKLYLTPHGTFASLSAPGSGLRERIYVPDPVDGSPLPHPEVIDYYEERARGGVGLIIFGHIEVQKGDSGRWHLTTPSAVEAWKPMIQRLHSHGTKVFAQLHCGFGSPSGLPGAGFVGEGFPEPITRDDIKRIVDLVGISARNAREAGFDGVELHAAHLHSTGLFLSGFTNVRTDEYGGSLENRLRFPLECLQAIRAAVDDTIAVGIRMPADEKLAEGVTATEAQDIVRALEAAGVVDFIDLDVGHSQHMWDVWSPHYQPDSYEVPYIAEVRSAIMNAVVLGAPGRLSDPAEAERIIQSGAMDMVGGTRGFFADPEWPRKALEMRSSEIRPCIGLNGCTIDGQCVMNPTNYLESLYGVTKLKKTSLPKQVVVVGGGPAGLEAARMAALRGHSATLLERSPILGGSLNLQKELPTRDGVQRASDWWGERLGALGVEVRTGIDASSDEIVALSPDVIVVATGATFDRTGVNGLTGRAIPGWDRDFVFTPETLLPSVPEVSGTVVVYEEDGAITASDIAWLMTQHGASKVHLVTRHPVTAQNYVTNRNGGDHRHLVGRELHASGKVETSTETFIRRIGDQQVTLFDIYTEEERTIEDVEMVVLVTLRKSRKSLAAELSDRHPDVRVLGDANSPGRMAKATRDGFLFGWNL